MHNTVLEPPSIDLVELGNLTFATTSANNIIELIDQHLARDPVEHGSKTLSISYINPHVFNLSQVHREVRHFIQTSDLVCIDGLGIKIALKLSYCRQPIPIHRVVALQLFDELCQRPAERRPAVLIGTEAQDVKLSATAINRLMNRFDIKATIDGFSSESIYASFLAQHDSIDWVLIGAGTPQSEKIANMAKRLCPNAIIFHMGAGSIKVYAGTKPRAAGWISSIGLEWLHRVWFEPHTRERYTKGAWTFFRHLFFPQRAKPK